MYKYIEKMLSELPLDMRDTEKTPSANHLLMVNDYMKKLNEKSHNCFII